MCERVKWMSYKTLDHFVDASKDRSRTIAILVINSMTDTLSKRHEKILELFSENRRKQMKQKIKMMFQHTTSAKLLGKMMKSSKSLKDRYPWEKEETLMLVLFIKLGQLMGWDLKEFEDYKSDLNVVPFRDGTIYHLQDISKFYKQPNEQQNSETDESSLNEKEEPVPIPNNQADSNFM